MKIIASGVFILLCINILFAQKFPDCQNVESDETTCWGSVIGHKPVEGGTVKKIIGQVITPNEEPIVDALIEVFENPDLEIEKRKRVAVSRTGKNGEFNFEDLRPGKYELRGSCGGEGFDAGHTIIILSPKDKNASSKKILVTLNISI